MYRFCIRRKTIEFLQEKISDKKQNAKTDKTKIFAGIFAQKSKKHLFRGGVAD